MNPYFKRIISLLFPLLAVSIVVFPKNSFAVQYTGNVQIEYIGCHTGNDNICYLFIEGGGTYGPPACESNTLRWDRSTSNGNATLAILIAAFMAGKAVNFAVNDAACFALQPSFPTFDYASVYQY